MIFVNHVWCISLINLLDLLLFYEYMLDFSNFVYIYFSSFYYRYVQVT